MKYKKNVFTDQKLKHVKLKRISSLLSYCEICSYDVDFVSLKFYKWFTLSSKNKRIFT